MPICYKFGLWINMAGVVEEKACFVSLCVWEREVGDGRCIFM